MKITNYFICFAAAQLSVIGICNAQNIKPVPATIVIDGSATEWKDFTAYSSGDAKINYAISNDKDNLYVIMETDNNAQISNILNSGISFSVDVKGRKKDTYSVTFPSSNGGAHGRINSKVQILAMIEAAKYKKIKAEGFKDIKDEEIDFSNSYNIKTAIGYEDGKLIYEEAIPLALFNADEFIDKLWAFNIKINGNSGNEGGNSTFIDGNSNVITRRGAPGSGGNGGGGGGAGAPGRNGDQAVTAINFNNAPPVEHNIEFWVKSTLAKP